LLNRIASIIAGTDVHLRGEFAGFGIHSLEWAPLWEKVFAEMSARICANLRRVR
jgi:hypothetical protein